MEEGRPMTNGIIMWGKTTTSRSGTMGRVSITSALSLSRPNILGGLRVPGDDGSRDQLRACAAVAVACSSAASRTPLWEMPHGEGSQKATTAVRRGRSAAAPAAPEVVLADLLDQGDRLLPVQH